MARLARNQNNSCALSSFSMATKGDAPKKLANVQRAKTSVNDNCRLCGCPLKIKYGECKKNSYVSTQNLFKVSKHEGCKQGLTLAELCSHIGLEIEKSDTFSDRVCHPVVGKYGTHLSSVTSSPQI